MLKQGIVAGAIVTVFYLAMCHLVKADDHKIHPVCEMVDNKYTCHVDESNKAPEQTRTRPHVEIPQAPELTPEQHQLYTDGRGVDERRPSMALPPFSSHTTVEIPHDVHIRAFGADFWIHIK